MAKNIKNKFKKANILFFKMDVTKTKDIKKVFNKLKKIKYMLKY